MVVLRGRYHFRLAAPNHAGVKGAVSPLARHIDSAHSDLFAIDVLAPPALLRTKGSIFLAGDGRAGMAVDEPAN